MDEALVLVTGFGPFPGCHSNPSREVAAALEREPPPGVRVVARELPVTFRGAPAAVRAAVAELGASRPAALLGLGVHSESGFRLERRARGTYGGGRADNAGESPAGLDLPSGPDLATDLDLEALAGLLRRVGADDVRISDDAGGYVCEITYLALLTAGADLGVPALFLHVPPAERLTAGEQEPIVRALVAALAGQAAARGRDARSARPGA